jgi:hypothetical protein
MKKKSKKELDLDFEGFKPLSCSSIIAEAKNFNWTSEKRVFTYSRFNNFFFEEVFNRIERPEIDLQCSLGAIATLLEINPYWQWDGTPGQSKLTIASCVANCFVDFTLAGITIMWNKRLIVTD